MRAQPLKRGCAGHGKDWIRAHATTDDVPATDDVRTRIGPFSCPHASVSHIRARKRLFSFPTWFNSQLGHGYGRFCAQSLHSATFGHGQGLFCARPEGWPTPTSLRSSLPTSPSWSFDHSYPPGPSHDAVGGTVAATIPPAFATWRELWKPRAMTPPSPNQATIGLQSGEEGGRTGMVAQPATFWGIYRSGEDPVIQARYVQGAKRSRANTESWARYVSGYQT